MAQKTFASGKLCSCWVPWMFPEYGKLFFTLHQRPSGNFPFAQRSFLCELFILTFDTPPIRRLNTDLVWNARWTTFVTSVLPYSITYKAFCWEVAIFALTEMEFSWPTALLATSVSNKMNLQSLLKSTTERASHPFYSLQSLDSEICGIIIESPCI